MKRIHTWAMLLSLFVAACSTPAAEKTTTESKPKQLTASELPAQFYKKLKGTIGDGLKVTMDLFRQDSIFRGTYFYDNVGKPLTLGGKIAADGTITLDESNADYVKTGTFTLTMSNPDEMAGTWVKPNSKNSLPVSLKTTTEGVASATTETFFEENCKMRYADSPDAEELVESWTDTLCPYIRVELITIQSTSADVDARINSSIVSDIIGDPDYKTIKDYVHSVQAIKEPGYEGVDHSCMLTTNDYGVLCVSIWHSWDGGGAHPIGSISHHNFSLNTGNAILLADVVDMNRIKELESLGEAIFHKTYGDEVFELEDGFHLGDNFAITTEGLMFSFSPYEMGPYSIGTADIVLPYRDIKDMLLKNGPTSRFPMH